MIWFCKGRRILGCVCDPVPASVGFQFVHRHSMDVETVVVLIRLSPRDSYPLFYSNPAGAEAHFGNSRQQFWILRISIYIYTETSCLVFTSRAGKKKTRVWRSVTTKNEKIWTGKGVQTVNPEWTTYSGGAARWRCRGALHSAFARGILRNRFPQGKRAGTAVMLYQADQRTGFIRLTHLACGGGGA